MRRFPKQKGMCGEKCCEKLHLEVVWWDLVLQVDGEAGAWTKWQCFEGGDLKLQFAEQLERESSVKRRVIHEKRCLWDNSLTRAVTQIGHKFGKVRKVEGRGYVIAERWAAESRCENFKLFNTDEVGWILGCMKYCSNELEQYLSGICQEEILNWVLGTNMVFSQLLILPCAISEVSGADASWWLSDRHFWVFSWPFSGGSSAWEL